MMLVITLIPFDDRNVYISTENIFVLKQTTERDLSIRVAITLDLPVDTLIIYIIWSMLHYNYYDFGFRISF